MTPLHYRQPLSKTLFFWALSLTLLGISAGSYYKQFYLPYRKVSFKGCPASCTYDSDCAVPGCSSKLRCIKDRCRFPNQHSRFINFSILTFLGLCGLLAGFVAYAKQANALYVHDKGLRYVGLFKTVEMSWEEFLGVSYHGVNTRFGKDATVYSLTGDSGLFSFLAPGLPKGTSTRELALGSFFWLTLSAEERDELMAAIEQCSGQTPEPEYEW